MKPEEIDIKQLIFEANIGLNKELLYIPIEPKDVLDCIEDAFEFGKWLNNIDNGITHYNPLTGEESESIGFSPSECYREGNLTVQELYSRWVGLRYNKSQ
jgi:hypothetical protein